MKAKNTISTLNMHEKAQTSYLKQRREEHLMSLMYMRALDKMYQDTTNRVTRQAEAILLYSPIPKTTKFMKAPICMGSANWNKLPAQIRKCKTRLGFKMRVRKYISDGLNINRVKIQTNIITLNIPLPTQLRNMV